MQLAELRFCGKAGAVCDNLKAQYALDGNSCTKYTIGRNPRDTGIPACCPGLGFRSKRLTRVCAETMTEQEKHLQVSSSVMQPRMLSRLHASLSYDRTAGQWSVSIRAADACSRCGDGS